MKANRTIVLLCFTFLALSAQCEEARNTFEDECKKGNAEQCLFAGQIFRKGRGVEMNLDKALDYYRRGCKLKNWTACARIGKTLILKAHQQALPYFEKTCEANQQSACYSLAFSKRTLKLSQRAPGSQLTREDREEYIPLLRRACENGEGLACRNAARSIGSTLNLTIEKIELYTKGCAAGDKFSCGMASNLKKTLNNESAHEAAGEKR